MAQNARRDTIHLVKYAVVRIQGHQYKVAEGDEVLVDKVADPKKVEAEVLLVVSDDKAKIGKPIVKDAKVSFKVLKDEEKGEKIHVRKYKSKSRYRKHTGFRAVFTRLLVQKIA